MQLRKDIWRCGIVDAPIDAILTVQSLEGHSVTWLPDSGSLRYLADPFGLWRDGRLFVLAEHFDYRDASGRIVAFEYDARLNLIRQDVVLREPWHLSYPFVIEAGGETWLLPESFEAQGLWLYRAVEFPWRWERAARITLDSVPLDATPFHDGQRWWLFYAPAFPRDGRLTQLCAAWADRLEGPWQSYPANPFFADIAGARPGGTPTLHDGNLVVPLQGCVGTYGRSLRLLRIDSLRPGLVAGTVVAEVQAPVAAAPFVDGCHTLSAAGAVTLIDVKRTRFSPGGLLVRPFRGRYRRERAAAPYRW